MKFGAELSLQRDGIDREPGLNSFIDAIGVLPIADAIDVASHEKIRLRLSGTPLEDNFDLLIGCTAIANDMMMVTDNMKDFKNLQGIRLENWIRR